MFGLGDGVRTYIDVTFNQGSVDPGELIEKLKGIGVQVIFGPHDIGIDWTNHNEFRDAFSRVQVILKEARVSYRLVTYENEEGKMVPISVLIK